MPTLQTAITRPPPASRAISRAPQPRGGAPGPALPAAGPGIGWDLSGVPVAAPLPIGRRDDPREAAADRAAALVLASPATLPSLPAAPAQLSRRCAACEATEEPALRDKAAAGAPPMMAPAIVHQVLRAPGRPLAAATQAFFGPRFGHDLGQVRLHDDAQASASARQVGALAYAVGRDIVFDASHAQPESSGARPLLAHELAHVVQQAGARPVLARQPVDAGRSTEEDRMLNCIIETQHTEAGVISDQDAFVACREKWHWTGPDLVPTADDRRQINTGVLVAPEDMSNYQQALADYLAWRQAGTVPADLQAWVDPAINTTQHLLAPYMPAVEQATPGEKLRVQAAGLPAVAAILAAQRGAVALQGTTALARAASSWGVAGLVPEAGAVAVGTGEAAAVGTGAAAGTAVAPVAAAVLGVAAIALAGYLAYRFLGWLGTVQVVPTIPQLPDAVRDTTLRIRRTGEHLVPADRNQPHPVPVPQPKPRQKEERRRKCRYPTGLTADDPIAITWFKPRHDSFYPRYLNLQDGVVDRDDPGARLPDGTRIGVRQGHWPYCNKPLRLIGTRRGGRAAEYRAMLASFGFDWRTMQPDHVQDLYWEGPDSFDNLWPYETSTNLSTGSTQNLHQFVDFCLTKDGPAYPHERISWNRSWLAGRYFIIKRFRMHADAPDLITCP